MRGLQGQNGASSDLKPSVAKASEIEVMAESEITDDAKKTLTVADKLRLLQDDGMAISLPTPSASQLGDYSGPDEDSATWTVYLHKHEACRHEQTFSFC